MEVTNANAGTMLPYIAALLRESAFFALDLEFTGMDRDGLASGASTSADIVKSFLRKPSDIYPQKLETLKPFSIVQIGISIFTPRASTAGGAVEHIFRATVQDLAADVAEFIPSIESKDYYTTFLDAVVREFEKVGYANGWTATMKLTLKERAHIGEQMSAVCAGKETQSNSSASSPPYTTNSVAELLRRYHFLEALFRILACRSRELEQLSHDVSTQKKWSNATPHSTFTSPTPAAESYNVQTFTAYMFPAVLDESQKVSLNVETAEFLVKNNIDLMRWVREGLRFKPLKNLASALAEDAASQVENMEQLLHPHTKVPGFMEAFKSKLDDLLPLSPGELQFVEFVLNLCAAPVSPAASHIAPFYVGATRPLLRFARGETADLSMPKPIFIKDGAYRDEVNALAAIGLTKTNQKFMRISNISGSGIGGGGISSSSCSSASDAALTSLQAAQGYGTALFETILYATEVAQKPIVLYNGYTDLMFLLLSFYGPQGMPVTLETFKAVVHRHFPKIYDTRILACSSLLEGLGNFTGKLANAVEEMAKVSAVASQVSFEFDSLVAGGDDPSLSSAAHNAGFDAMLTGKLFVYARRAIMQTSSDYKLYQNFLAMYSTLLSINLNGKEDGVLPGEPTTVFFLSESFGLRLESVRDALARNGLRGLVMFRGVGYTIQPVGESCLQQDYRKLVEAELSRQARTPVTLLRIDI